MRPVTLSRTLVAGAAGAICASQTPGGAGNLVINGTLASGGVATNVAQRLIAINAGATNMSGVNFTVFGTDDQNRPISEVIPGPNATVTNSVLNYLTVTQIAVSGAPGGALTVDTVGIGASQEIVLDQYLNPVSVQIGAEVTGTINYTGQYTLDDIFGGAPGPYVWNTITGLSGQTTTQTVNLAQPARALRVLTNSGAGTVKFIVVQGGLRG